MLPTIRPFPVSQELIVCLLKIHKGNLQIFSDKSNEKDALILNINQTVVLTTCNILDKNYNTRYYINILA